VQILARVSRCALAQGETYSLSEYTSLPGHSAIPAFIRGNGHAILLDGQSLQGVLRLTQPNDQGDKRWQRDSN
jgi:hypothetical protein